MDKQTINAVQQWMFKADHDLRSALKLKAPGSQGPLLDTAAYHCQQAAEKALKAYLTANEIAFPKIHLLLPLLELCIDIDSSFVNLADATVFLTPFATEFRYPGDILEPDPADVDEACKMAENIMEFIDSKLANLSSIFCSSEDEVKK